MAESGSQPVAGPPRPPKLAAMKTATDDGKRIVYACPYGTPAHWSDWCFAGDRDGERRADGRYLTHVAARHPDGDRKVDETFCALCRGPLGLLTYRATRLIGVYCSEECRAIAEGRARFQIS